MEKVLIVGNGPTRKDIDIPKLIASDSFVSVGTNASYRDIKTDWLVALDDRIVEEIRASKYPLERFYVPPTEAQYEPAEYNPSRPRNNAGMVAMDWAIDVGYTDLYAVGLDFIIDDKELNLGNLYDGTNGYEMVT